MAQLFQWLTSLSHSGIKVCDKSKPLDELTSHIAQIVLTLLSQDFYLQIGPWCFQNISFHTQKSVSS